MAENRTTFSIAFYIRRTRLNKHGESPVHLRITVNCARADTTVKKTISPNLWDSVRGRASAKNLIGKELNLCLDAVRAKITRIAINREWLKKDPFADIRFSLHPVQRDFLEKQEIEKAWNKPIEIERLAQVRDVFIFCCAHGVVQSKDECVPEGTGRHLRHKKATDNPHRTPYLRHLYPGQWCFDI